MGGGTQGGDGAAVAVAAAQQALAAAENFEDANEALIKFFQEESLVKENDAKTLLSAIHAAIADTSADRPAPSLLNLMTERGLSSTEKSLALLVEKTRLPFVPIAIYEVDRKASSLEKSF